MTDKNIKRFQEEIWVKDTGTWLSQGNEHIRLLVEKMRDAGYVRVLDVDPYIRVEYNEGEDRFELLLTIQGVYVGKKEAWVTEGVSQGKSLPRATPESKSKPSSQESE